MNALCDIPLSPRHRLGACFACPLLARAPGSGWQWVAVAGRTGCLPYTLFNPQKFMFAPLPGHTAAPGLEGPALGGQTRLGGASPSGCGDVPISLPHTARPLRVQGLWVGAETSSTHHMCACGASLAMAVATVSPGSHRKLGDPCPCPRDRHAPRPSQGWWPAAAGVWHTWQRWLILVLLPGAASSAPHPSPPQPPAWPRAQS